MCQGGAEEELIADYAMDLHAPWEVPWTTAIGVIVLCFGSITGVVGMGAKASASSALLPMHGARHDLATAAQNRCGHLITGTLDPENKPVFGKHVSLRM